MKDNFQLLALDVDGTLLNSQHEISPRTQAALLKVQRMGIPLALVSGRPLGGILPLAQQLDMKRSGGWIIAYNGSQIYDVAKEEMLFERRVDVALLPSLERKAKKYGFQIFTYLGQEILSTTANDAHILNEAAINGMSIRTLEHWSKQIETPPCKVMFVSDDLQALQDLYSHWNKRMAGTVGVHMSEKFFLEILPPGIDKSIALSILLDHLHINSDNVAAFGDGIRDIGMLQLAGTGIAMGNAEESVRVCADMITGSNDQDGIVQVLDQAMEQYRQPGHVPLEEINRQMSTSLIGNLGITFTYASETRIEATMPVDQRTRQPFGILHGGATLALAETVAGMGSMLLIDAGEHAVGMQVSGNHISSAHEGDTVRAVATLLHGGRHSHVWNVDVFTSTNRLVSSVRVVNSILKK